MPKSHVRRFLIAALGVSFGFSALYGAAPQAHAATPRSQKLIHTGKQYLGVPYRFGAPMGDTHAFDCSSFTQYIFRKSGVSLPRTSITQAVAGKKVKYLSMGDLVFFKTNGRSISHVGIYAGYGKMLHSSSSKGITVVKMNTKYWKTRFVTARRVLS
jgi:cell wall-associated NlpC family hydrolase